MSDHSVRDCCLKKDAQQRHKHSLVVGPDHIIVTFSNRRQVYMVSAILVSTFGFKHPQTTTPILFCTSQTHAA